MLGYGKDSHSYRVFNIFHYKVVETMDVRFDETNDSQREHLPNVLDEVPPSESIKQMGIGDIIPSENQKRSLSFLHQVNPKTLLILAPMLKTKTMISKGKVFIQFIIVLQMKYRLRR